MAIISLILMISTNDLAKLLHGEIRCWSLSEFKGLNRLCKSVKKISFQWSNNIAQQFLIQTICLKILSLLCSFKVNNETFPSLKILSPSLTYVVVFLFISARWHCITKFTSLSLQGSFTSHISVLCFEIKEMSSAHSMIITGNTV